MSTALAVSTTQPIPTQSHKRNAGAYGLTDRGRRRRKNEDAFWVGDDLGVHVVCDGIGGHAAGEVASRMAVNTIRRQLRRRWLWRRIGGAAQRGADLAAAIRVANKRIYHTSHQIRDLEGMGTTVAAIALDRRTVTIAHVGDSRVYRFCARNGLERLTRDHSLLNALIDSGQLKEPEEIAAFGRRNVIVRSLGTREEVEPEVTSIPRRPDDIFLICSDGLSDMISDESIGRLLHRHRRDLPTAGQILVHAANEAGGRDNITAVLVRGRI